MVDAFRKEGLRVGLYHSLIDWHHPQYVIDPYFGPCRNNPETNRLYVHVFAWPYKHLYLDGKAYKDRVEYAQLLNDASEVKTVMEAWYQEQQNRTGTSGEGLALTLPVVKPGVSVPVIELFLKH